MRALYIGRDLGHLYPQLWLLRYVRICEGNPESFALYLIDTAYYGLEEWKDTEPEMRSCMRLISSLSLRKV